MIDVVFLLLVFFMLASRFGLDQVLPLPLAGSGGVYDGPPRLIDIAPEGVFVNGRAVDETALAQTVGALMQAPTDMLILRGRDGADLQRVISITDRLRDAGYSALVLVE